MPKLQYCWRCKMEIPMLDDREWKEIAPLLDDAICQIQQYRATHGVSLSEARENGFGQEALDKYFLITGFREGNPDCLWHHRLSLFGPPCRACGKPLRTPTAHFCAECGTARAE